MKFNEYFLMKSQDAAEYAQEKLQQIPWDKATIQAKEIGDGNLNYVFRVFDAKGNSVIVKHAGEALRISADMKVSTDRNRIESEILMLQDKFAKGLVPKIYMYDTVMCACIMEDLSEYQLMRYALMEHKTFPHFAEDITTYMVNTLLRTSDVVMEHKAKKELVKSFINPELCEITEDLVLTEPFNDINGRNKVFAPNAAFVKKELYEDTALHLEVAKIKFDFMNNAQALLHGDLHSGSIFVTQEKTKVFDPEFAFYGPMGYDIGNLVANLIFAWNNGHAYGKTEFCAWIVETIEKVMDLFIQKFKASYREYVSDAMAKTKGFMEHYLGTVLADTAAFAGTELIRRTVGMAQVKDITTIADEQKRAYAERVNIITAKKYIMNRQSYDSGADFVKTLHQAIEEAK